MSLVRGCFVVVFVFFVHKCTKISSLILTDAIPFSHEIKNEMSACLNESLTSSETPPFTARASHRTEARASSHEHVMDQTAYIT